MPLEPSAQHPNSGTSSLKWESVPGEVRVAYAVLALTASEISTDGYIVRGPWQVLCRHFDKRTTKAHLNWLRTRKVIRIIVPQHGQTPSVQKLAILGVPSAELERLQRTQAENLQRAPALKKSQVIHRDVSQRMASLEQEMKLLQGDLGMKLGQKLEEVKRTATSLKELLQFLVKVEAFSGISDASLHGSVKLAKEVIKIFEHEDSLE